MIRVVAWWLYREYLYARSIVVKDHEYEYYFAFGANLDPKVLRQRCFRVIEEQAYVLKDHCLDFSHPSPWEGTGFASVRPEAGGEVFGRIYKVPKGDAKRMDCEEFSVIFKRYRRETLDRKGQKVFYYVSSHPHQGLAPTSEYKGKILSGLREHPLIPKDKLKEFMNLSCRDDYLPCKDNHYFIRGLPKEVGLKHKALWSYEKVSRWLLLTLRTRSLLGKLFEKHFHSVEVYLGETNRDKQPVKNRVNGDEEN